MRTSKTDEAFARRRGRILALPMALSVALAGAGLAPRLGAAPVTEDDMRCFELYASKRLRDAAAPCLRSAEAGNVEAQYRLSRIIELGADPELTGDDAFRWLSLAAENGQPEAALAIGRLHESKADAPTAERWYRWAASFGSGEAYARLAQLAERKLIVMPEPQIFAWHEAGARLGNADCQALLAAHYLSEQNRNETLARHWLTIAAENGNPRAANDLGVLLNATDPERAAKWFAFAASRRQAQGYYNLARMHVSGNGGVSRDLDLARRLAHQAMVRGYRPAVDLIESIDALAQARRSTHLDGVLSDLSAGRVTPTPVDPPQQAELAPPPRPIEPDGPRPYSPLLSF